MRKVTLAVLVAVVLASAWAPAGGLALPQQQGSVDLLSQADGQFEGPGEAQGGSATGTSVVGLPDVFHRGRGAIAIGAPEANPSGRQAAGSVYVVPGQTGRAAVDLTALAGRGYRIDGAAAGDQLGFALAAMTLPSGHPGLAIGAPYASPAGRSQAGLIYVIDLRRLHGNVDLSSPRGNRAVVGVILGPRACAESGYALAAARPLVHRKGNALLDGAPGVDPAGCPTTTAEGIIGGNTGAAYLIFGGHVSSRLDLATAGGAAAEFLGVASGDRTGSAVAAVGRTRSFMIGAPDASPFARTGAGGVYLLHGATPGSHVSLASRPPGSTLFTGAQPDDELGFALTSTADFVSGQHHGVVDLAVGAPQASPSGRNEAGEVYVVPAAHQGGVVDLAGFGSGGGRRGLIIGADAGDEAGYALAGVGSLNGSGIPDLAIGAPFVNSQTGAGRNDNGAAYVLYGGTGTANIDLANFHSRGFVCFGARDSDEAGTAVAGVEDENGDGRSDVLIGAPFAENTLGSTPTVGGSVYVVLGFGRPALRYHPPTLTARVGRPVKPLVAIARVTGHARFSVSPALPAGLRLNRTTGRISGAPTAVSPLRSYTVELTDLAGAADATISIAVLH